MSKRILFIVDNLPRAQFFGRFVPACREQGVSFRFLPYRLSSQRYLHRLGHESDILRTRRDAGSRFTSEDKFQCECSQALEVISGDVGLQSVLRRAPAIASHIDSVIQSYSPTHLFLWNGSQLVDRIATRICPPEISKSYFEIGNFPDKMFVDRQGVNAASTLFRSPESLLATGLPSEEEFEAWRSSYYKAQASRGVPQATVAQSMQWERPADALASRLGYGFYPIGIRPMLARFWGKALNSSVAKSLIVRYRIPEDAHRPYRFFPLQVSRDTQLLLNSDVANIDALRRVVRTCQADGIDLIVKIHPAENSRVSLAQLDSILQESRHRCRIYLSDRPTTELIGGAEKVYTINSTVGLETLIAGKPLEVLGRAFYQHFVGRPDLLKCYLLRYLIPLDYFGPEAASGELLQQILSGWPEVAARQSAEMVCGP